MNTSTYSYYDSEYSCFVDNSFFRFWLNFSNFGSHFFLYSLIRVQNLQIHCCKPKNHSSLWNIWSLKKKCIHIMKSKISKNLVFVKIISLEINALTLHGRNIINQTAMHCLLTCLTSDKPKFAVTLTFFPKMC